MVEGKGVAQARTHLLLNVRLLRHEVGNALRVAATFLQSLEFSAQRGEAHIIRVVYIEVHNAGGIRVKGSKDLGKRRQRQVVRETEGRQRLGGFTGKVGEVLNLEELHLVEHLASGKCGKGALKVVQLHETMAQVVVSTAVALFSNAVDNLLQQRPTRLKHGRIGRELLVEHHTTAGRRHKFHVVNNKLKSGILFYKLFYLHCSIFITS